jgi:hypothetical protein
MERFSGESDEYRGHEFTAMDRGQHIDSWFTGSALVASLAWGLGVGFGDVSVGAC